MTAINSNNEAEFCIFYDDFLFPTVTDAHQAQRCCKWLLGDGTAQDKMVSRPDGFHVLNAMLAQSHWQLSSLIIRNESQANTTNQEKLIAWTKKQAFGRIPSISVGL